MTDSLTHFRSYIESQFREGGLNAAAGPPFVTISRQAGAGGITIGRLLQERLKDMDGKSGVANGWTIFDKNLVQEVLQDHRLSERLAEYMEEDSLSEIDDILSELFGLHPAKWTLVKKTSETILHLAKAGRVILVGRGAHLVTRRLPGGLHVRLIGTLRRRIEHLKEYFGFDSAEAADFVKREDEGRRRYLKTYFDKDIDDPLLYDLVIRTDEMDYESVAGLIAYALRHKHSPRPALV